MSTRQNILLWTTFILACFGGFVANIVVLGISPFYSLVLTIVAATLLLAWFRLQYKRSRKWAQEQYERLENPHFLMEYNSRRRERKEILGHCLTFWTVVSFISIIVFSIILFFQRFDLMNSSFLLYGTEAFRQIGVMPLFLFMWMFIWYGSLTIPGYLRARVIMPGDADYGVRLSSVRAQDQAVIEAKKQLKLLQGWSERKKTSRPGLFTIIAGFLLWWLLIPLLMLRMIWMKYILRKRDEQIQMAFMKPQHMLFSGPPGTGKTYLGMALATESNLPVLLLPATVMHQPFMGVGVILWNLIQHFKIYGTAKKHGGVIVIIDEIDSFARTRQGMGSPSSSLLNSDYSSQVLTSCGLTVNDPDFYRALNNRSDLFASVVSRFFGVFPAPVPGAGMWGAGGLEAVLTQVMMMLDGIHGPPLVYQLKRGLVNMAIDAFFGWAFLIGLPSKITIHGKSIYFRLPPGKPEDVNMLMIGLTNLREALDPALLRSGRLGLHVPFVNPNHEGIKQVAEEYYKRHPHDPALDTEGTRNKFARLMRKSSPVQIKEVIEAAAYLAVEREEAYGKKQPPFDWNDVVEARRNIKYGRYIPGVHSEESEYDTTVHEYGHLLTAMAFLEGIEEVIEFSVVARGNSKGRVDTAPVDEKSDKSGDRMAYEANLRVFLAGRVIEEIIFNEQRSGAKHDFAALTAIVSYMVGELMYTPRDCSENDRKRYERIGLDLLSLSATSPLGRSQIVEDVLSKESFREKAAVFLGQAYVDTREFLEANKDALLAAVNGFFERGEMREYSGPDLEDMTRDVSLSPLPKQVTFPNYAYANPFRDLQRKDGAS